MTTTPLLFDFILYDLKDTNIEMNKYEARTDFGYWCVQDFSLKQAKELYCEVSVLNVTWH